MVELAYAGDTVLITPFLHNLSSLGEWEIHLVVSEPYVKLMRRCEAVSEVWGYSKKRDSPWRFGRKLRRVGYEVAFVLHRSFYSALIPIFAGIRTRVGYNTEMRGFLLTHPQPYDRGLHRAENHLLLFERFTGSKAERVPPSLSHRAMEEFRGWVLLNPNASWESKRFPLRVFQLLSSCLSGRRFGVLGSGEAEDRRRARELAELVGGEDLSGEFSLHELPDLLAAAEMVLSCDSGPAHISTAVNTKTVVLFSSTDPRLCGPFPDYEEVNFSELTHRLGSGRLNFSRLVARNRVECSPCYAKVCPKEVQVCTLFPDEISLSTPRERGSSRKT